MLRTSVSWLEFLFIFLLGTLFLTHGMKGIFSPLTLQKPLLPLSHLEIIRRSVYSLLYFNFQCLSIELFEQAFHPFMENVLLLFIRSGWKPSNAISCTCDSASKARNSVCASSSICIYELTPLPKTLSVSSIPFLPLPCLLSNFLCCA